MQIISYYTNPEVRTYRVIEPSAYSSESPGTSLTSLYWVHVSINDLLLSAWVRPSALGLWTSKCKDCEVLVSFTLWEQKVWHNLFSLPFSPADHANPCVISVFAYLGHSKLDGLSLNSRLNPLNRHRLFVNFDWQTKSDKRKCI